MRMNTDHEHSKQQTKQSRWGFRGMTVRDWLQLLIVPLALVAISFLFTAQQDQRQQQIEDQRAQAERELAEQRAQDEALQAYLDQMSGLLLEKDLRTSEEDSEVRTLARARALTVLERLDPSRKTAVVQFLVEAKLVQRVAGTGPIISLNGADLSGAYLFSSALSGADLERADLGQANLSDADLSWADLRGRPGRGPRCHQQRARAASQFAFSDHNAQRPEVRGLAQEQGPGGEQEERRFFLASQSHEDGFSPRITSSQKGRASVLRSRSRRAGGKLAGVPNMSTT